MVPGVVVDHVDVATPLRIALAPDPPGEVKGVSLILLAAGFDTTANTLALDTFALLRNPAELAALRADPRLPTRPRKSYCAT